MNAPARARRGRAGRLAALLLLLAGTGCETVIKLELPEPEPRLVVNSVLNPDSLFLADVSASRSIFSNEKFVPVENAVVQLYEAGQLLEELRPAGRGRYAGRGRPHPLLAYELRVRAPGFPSVRARTELPAPPAIREVRARRAPPVSGGSSPSVEASFVLTDDPARENFYYLQAYEPDTARFFGNEPYLRPVAMQLLAPFEQEFTMETRYFFSDRLFNGQAVRLRLSLENNPAKTTYMRVAHVSKSYYDYVRALDRQSYGDNVLPSPVSVANNIENGFGLFGSYAAQTLLLKP